MKRERLEGVLVGLLYGFAQAGTPWQVGEDDAVAVIRTLSIVLNAQRSVKPRIQLLTSATSARTGNRLLHQEHALAGRLRVEQLVGLFGLVELPAVGEQRLDIDPAVRDELRAFGLADRREGPRGDDRQLLPEHVGADIDRHVVALA